MRRLVSVALFLTLTQGAIANDFVGQFEQVYIFKRVAADPAIEARAQEKFARIRIIIRIDASHLHVALGEAPGDEISVPYKLHGQFLLAEGDDGYHWVLYLHDGNTIFSSVATFVRVDE